MPFLKNIDKNKTLSDARQVTGFIVSFGGLHISDKQTKIKQLLSYKSDPMTLYSLTDELMQIRPNWFVGDDKDDANRWSRVHPRFQMHDGCIVDLGCLGWNRPFEEIDSDNWAGYFFDKKRVIGVDPQETMNSKAELFKGFVANFSGKGSLVSNGLGATLLKSSEGNFEVLNWNDFKQKFNIKSISILKINIEGSEWDLIDSFNSADFFGVDQICISFHDWLTEFSECASRTDACVKKIMSNGYSMVDLDIYGWKLFLRT